MAMQDLVKLGASIKKMVPNHATPEEREIFDTSIDVMICALAKMSTVADSLERIAKAAERANDNYTQYHT